MLSFLFLGSVVTLLSLYYWVFIVNRNKKLLPSSSMATSSSNSSSTNPTRPPHIVIFGGGFAGTKLFLQLIRTLKPNDAEVTLINATPFLFYDVAIPRALADPNHTPIEKLLYPLTSMIPSSHSKSTNSTTNTTPQTHTPPKFRVVIGHIDEIHPYHALISRVIESGTTPTSNWFTSFIPATYLSDETHERFCVHFDYGVMAMGSLYEFPGKWPSHHRTVSTRPPLQDGASSVSNEPQAPSTPSPSTLNSEIQHHDAFIKKFKNFQSQLQHQAKKVLVIGGGPVGIELAAEIKSAFPEKSVTLACTTLFHTSPSFLKKLKSILSKKEIQVLENTRVDISTILKLTQSTSFPIVLPSLTSLPLTSTTSIETDFIFLANGVQPNTSMVKCPNALSDTHWVQVHPSFQLLQYPHLFAIGDCIQSFTGGVGGKFAFIAVQHADMVAENLIQLIHFTQRHLKPYPSSSKLSLKEHLQEQLKSVKLKTFPVPPPLCVLALGKNDGVTQLPVIGTLFGNYLTKLVKGDGGFMTARRFFGPSLFDQLQSKGSPSSN
ncbi:Apoptosis-inducing factor 2 [Coelomomyces lativittatus]|nr:Apoptosis-inducing factor 2 [Coelomomyces lativittatus]KAJ1514377.1 Apoptosis-inducing factor 2 [Coelomomyces lativittatus]KAJ1514727.1 Apoptosis-inducing factor 2 [Coelomomyces lativittatus]